MNFKKIILISMFLLSSGIGCKKSEDSQLQTTAIINFINWAYPRMEAMVQEAALIPR